MVISHKMSENKMGYRGSKSVLDTNTVKEQRVDGSWFINLVYTWLINLRCTLMGFERNYPIKIPSNQLKYSSNADKNENNKSRKAGRQAQAWFNWSRLC